MKRQLLILQIIAIILIFQFNLYSQTTGPSPLPELVDSSQIILVSKVKSDTMFFVPDSFEEESKIFSCDVIKVLKGIYNTKILEIFAFRDEEYCTEIPGKFYEKNDVCLFFLKKKIIPDSIRHKHNFQDRAFYIPIFDGEGIFVLKDSARMNILHEVEQLCAIIPSPPADGVTSAQLADSLGIKLNAYASSSSIGDDKFVESLKKQIKQIQTHIQKGKKDIAIQEIGKFKEKLHNVYFKIGGQDQRFITPDAYGYLYYTAQYIIDLLNSGDNGGGGSGGGGGGGAS